MTKEEIQEAEQCVQHMREETTRPHHISRNALENHYVQPLTKNEIAFSNFVFNEQHDGGLGMLGQDNYVGQDVLFNDVHEYKTTQC